MTVSIAFYFTYRKPPWYIIFIFKALHWDVISSVSVSSIAGSRKASCRGSNSPLWEEAVSWFIPKRVHWCWQVRRIILMGNLSINIMGWKAKERSEPQPYNWLIFIPRLTICPCSSVLCVPGLAQIVFGLFIHLQEHPAQKVRGIFSSSHRKPFIGEINWFYACITNYLIAIIMGSVNEGLDSVGEGLVCIVYN